MNSKGSNNWKVFRKDTEAGRLLSRLYGVESSSSHAAAAQAINYPKLRTRRKSDLEQRSRWNAQNQSDLSKHRQQKAASASVMVPRVGRKKNESAALMNTTCTTTSKNRNVSYIPRRKTHKACLATIDDNRIHNQQYRPPNHITNSVAEKEKLCNVFENNDGNALPKSALPSREQREEWIAANAAGGASTYCSPKNNGGTTSNKSVSTTESEQASSCSMAMQLAQEIKERREFQNAMEKCAAGDSTREQTVHEISIRMKELMKYDPNLAKSLIDG